jgi:hypothetical protein
MSFFNGDVAALAQGLMGPAVQPSFEAVPAQHRSLSAFTLSMLAETSGFSLGAAQRILQSKLPR